MKNRTDIFRASGSEEEGMKRNVAIRVDPGLPTILTVLFVLLKVFDKLDWSWWWVFSPLWIPFAIVLAIVIIVIICKIIVECL